jgi:N-methylhydantoinase A
MRVATDVGGTFTDLVYCDYDEATGQPGAVVAVKCDTTPPDFERGVMQALELARLPAASIAFFAHGTTVVINALTERTGARVGLITTAGFRDVLEIARGNRPDLFNYMFVKPAPFVPRHLRLEVRERLDQRGRVVTPLDLAGVAPIVERFRVERVDAVAICLLHAYANSSHEDAVEQELRRLWPELRSVLVSHRITREWREYERTSTTVLSAYVHPRAQGYLDRLERRLGESGVRAPVYIMQSNGGVATVRAAGANPINMVESGPASGVLGAIALGRIIGEPSLITLDIGGTTAKCSLVEASRARITTDYKFEWSPVHPGYPIKAPVLDLVEIGSGGGSIAWLDPGGRLHVGPRSAGAVPGPAAYGRGGVEPTVTDANLIAGRIDPGFLLGGRIAADMANARRAYGELGARLDASVEETARGVLRVVNANMVHALKLVSVNRGFDPREFTLMAFGGGGGLHGAALARDLGVGRVVVPVNAAVFSAWGMLMTDLRRDLVRTRVVALEPTSADLIAKVYEELASELATLFSEDGADVARLNVLRYADMRYVGQEHSVKAEFPAGTVTADAIGRGAEAFHLAHEREYGFRLDSPVELVNFHVAGLLAVAKPALPRQGEAGGDASRALRGYRRVDYAERGVHESPVYLREKLSADVRLAGPAIIEEPATTVVVPPGDAARVDEYGNIHITIEQERAG